MPSLKSHLVSLVLKHSRKKAFSSAENMQRWIAHARRTQTHRPPPRLAAKLAQRQQPGRGVPVYEVTPRRGAAPPGKAVEPGAGRRGAESPGPVVEVEPGRAAREEDVERPVAVQVGEEDARVVVRGREGDVPLLERLDGLVTRRQPARVALLEEGGASDLHGDRAPGLG